MKTAMSKLIFNSSILAVLLIPLGPGCSSSQLAHTKPAPATPGIGNAVSLPQVHENAIPNTGSVVEYWPDGRRKSERTYRDGKIVIAVYFASDGTRVYEMFEAREGN